MKVTEVNIQLVSDKESRKERLLAFCSVTFDHMFVIHDMKIIEGFRGVFVSMPSRKLTDRCGCGNKNHLSARFCSMCGYRLREDRATYDDRGRIKLYADVAHPVNAQSRKLIQDEIIRLFYEEVEKAKQPDYVCRYNEFDAGEETFGLYESLVGR